MKTLFKIWNSRLSSHCRNTDLFPNLHTSVTWFGYFLSLRYFRCKQSADKSNIQCVKSHFQKIFYRLNILFKTNPMIINLTWYDCDIISRGSIIFHKKGPGKGGKTTNKEFIYCLWKRQSVADGQALVDTFSNLIDIQETVSCY